ncbi:MAG: hypothetical protein WBP16_14435, partial [Ferruginibacter sp.]
MKQKLTLILALSLFATSAFSQKNKMRNDDKKGPLFGLSFIMTDFNAPNGIKDPSTGKVYSRIKDMDKGFSLSYWRGLTNKIDFSIRANGIFRDYRAIRTGLTQKTEIGLELEPSIHLRPFTDAAMFNPFLTVGVGGGYYTDKIGAFLPAGLGLQVNFNSTTYLFLQANYRWGLTKDILDEHLFYSFGFAQNIGKEKVKVAPPPPPPPPPPAD